MNGLALLCNLFADGPVTLKRLRTAHLDTLADLERTPTERLAAVLHASIPQASAFVDEARKLGQRLSEEARIVLPAPVRVVERDAEVVEREFVLPCPAPAAPPATRDAALAPGILPGLDEALCARLLRNRVRSVRALAEFAGLALARRTGIPYATLLALAREARRFTDERAHEQPMARPGAISASALDHEPPLGPPHEHELDGPDGFTLPRHEPPAGPFG